MERYYKIVSTCCYIIENGKVLLLHREKLEGLKQKKFYRGLGGKAEQGEDPVQCVIREVKEESGLNIVPIWKGIVTISKEDEIDWEIHAFLSNKFDGEIIKECEEGKLVWVEINELDKLEMPEGDKLVLNKLFEDTNFMARFVYDKNKDLIDYSIKTL